MARWRREPERHSIHYITPPEGYHVLLHVRLLQLSGYPRPLSRWSNAKLVAASLSLNRDHFTSTSSTSGIFKSLSTIQTCPSLGSHNLTDQSYEYAIPTPEALTIAATASFDSKGLRGTIGVVSESDIGEFNWEEGERFPLYRICAAFGRAS